MGGEQEKRGTLGEYGCIRNLTFMSLRQGFYFKEMEKALGNRNNG